MTGTLGLNGTNSNALTGAHLINKGVATETGDYIGLNNSSVLENAGTLNLTDGFEIFSNDTTANQLENDASGTINYTGSTASSTTSISVSTTNNGLISVTKGTLTDTELTNLVSGTLTGGSYNATNGTINVGAVITTNAANITLGGLAGLIGNGSASALSTLKTNSGTLTLNGRGLSVLAALTNSGTITLTTGTLQVSSFTQSGGTTTLPSPAVLKAGSGTAAVAINGGLLTGTGQVQGILTNKGTVKPSGNVAGPMTGTSTYTQSTSGVLLIPISGSTSAWDRLRAAEPYRNSDPRGKPHGGDRIGLHACARDHVHDLEGLRRQWHLQLGHRQSPLQSRLLRLLRSDGGADDGRPHGCRAADGHVDRTASRPFDRRDHGDREGRQSEQRDRQLRGQSGDERLDQRGRHLPDGHRPRWERNG